MKSYSGPPGREEFLLSAIPGRQDLGKVLSTLVDTLEASLWQLDLDYTVRSVNQQAERVYGPGIVGQKCHEWVAGSSQVCRDCPVKRGYASKVVQRSVREHRRDDGETMYVEHLATPILDRHGSLQGALVLLFDITHHKTLEHELRQQSRHLTELAENRGAELKSSHDKFAAAFAVCPDGIVIARLGDDRIIEINRSFTEITGFSETDAIGRTLSEIGLWSQPAARQKILTALHHNASCRPLESSLRTMDGRLVSIEVSARQLDLEEEPHLICFIRDLTPHRQQEKEREKLISAISATHDVVVITDADGVIEFVNPAFESVTGYTRDEALGNNPRILQSGRHDRNFYRELWQTITSGQTFSGRMVNKKKDGTLYTEEATISPIHDHDGKIVSYIGVKRDITAQLELENQLLQARKMEAVGRLTGGVAHDFNNILSVIIGNAELALEDCDLTPDLHRALRHIIEAAERSATIIAQLLAFSRQQVIAPQHLDLNGHIEKMLEMLKRLIGEEVEIDFYPAPEKTGIKMDPAQLDQVLTNMCINARDSLDGPGRIVIETATARLDPEYCELHAGLQPGDYLVLTVSDDGCGIDKDQLPLIFEPFYTTKKSGRGTGLGLATVYGIVTQNNGCINVYSEVGQGTTFKIYLPPEEGTVMETRATIPAQPDCRGGETILLVEDEDSVRLMMRNVLKRLGYRVIDVEGPEEALAAVERERAEIDLLLTDVVMPKMNGRELATLLQQKLPRLKILFMSGYTSNVVAHKGIMEAGLHFVQKPFSKKVLADKIRAAMTDT